jgi:hypothetical protein
VELNHRLLTHRRLSHAGYIGLTGQSGMPTASIDCLDGPVAFPAFRSFLRYASRRRYVAR